VKIIVTIGPFDDQEWDEVAEILRLIMTAIPPGTSVPIISMVEDDTPA
jgi:hypothetical protein